MSCNGCRVLRKGCSDCCILRQCLKWIESSDAQGHATVFVAKFFGRAGMMALIGSVPESQRPALFQSLLYEACGRTINPVFGAVGLLCSGNWDLCQEAVETVLKGGLLCSSSTGTGTGKPGSMHPFRPAPKYGCSTRGLIQQQQQQQQQQEMGSVPHHLFSHDLSSMNFSHSNASSSLKRKAAEVSNTNNNAKYDTSLNYSSSECRKSNKLITNNDNNTNTNRRCSSRRRVVSLDDEAECNKTTIKNRCKLRVVKRESEQDDEVGLDLTLGSSTGLQLPLTSAPKRTSSPCPSEADSDTTELSISPWSNSGTAATLVPESSRMDRLLNLLR